MLQVARNRCRDYYRSTQRRELFVETQALAPAALQADRAG